MLIQDITEKQVWGRRGTKLVRKYRCTSGARKGRTVAKMSQCFAAPNLKKKTQMKKIRARLGAKMARKARRTKRMNPASKTLARLNKRR